MRRVFCAVRFLCTIHAPHVMQHLIQPYDDCFVSPFSLYFSLRRNEIVFVSAIRRCTVTLWLKVIVGANMPSQNDERGGLWSLSWKVVFTVLANIYNDAAQQYDSGTKFCESVRHHRHHFLVRHRKSYVWLIVNCLAQWIARHSMEIEKFFPRWHTVAHGNMYFVCINAAVHCIRLNVCLRNWMEFVCSLNDRVSLFSLYFSRFINKIFSSGKRSFRQNNKKAREGE